MVKLLTHVNKHWCTLVSLQSFEALGKRSNPLPCPTMAKQSLAVGLQQDMPPLCSIMKVLFQGLILNIWSLKSCRSYFKEYKTQTWFSRFANRDVTPHHQRNVGSRQERPMGRCDSVHICQTKLKITTQNYYDFKHIPPPPLPPSSSRTVLGSGWLKHSTQCSLSHLRVHFPRKYVPIIDTKQCISGSNDYFQEYSSPTLKTDKKKLE